MKIKIKKVLTRSRFIKKYQTKKRLLIAFLIIVNLYIYATLFVNCQNWLPSVEIKWGSTQGSFIVENSNKGQFLKPSEVVAVKEMSIEDKIEAVFGDEAKTAIAIAKSESGLKNVKGDIPLEYEWQGKVIGHSCGIFQIRVLPDRPNCEELMNVDTNIAYAKKIYDRTGWSAWSNYTNQRYLAFLQ